MDVKKLEPSDLMEPQVHMLEGKRFYIGFTKEDWLTKPHDPDTLPLYVIVEDIKPNDTSL